MDDDRRASLRTSAPSDPVAGGFSSRDSASTPAHAALDEAAAAEARARYRVEAPQPLEPDPTIARVLHPGEHVYATRRAAVLDRRQLPTTDPGSGLAGDLYVTSERLVLVGRVAVEFRLADIAEADLLGERLLLVMCDGVGVAVDVTGPRLLRVEIAAARRASSR